MVITVVLLRTTTNDRDILQTLSPVLATSLPDRYKSASFINEELTSESCNQNHLVDRWRAGNSSVVLSNFWGLTLFLVKRSPLERTLMCAQRWVTETTPPDQVQLCVWTAVICHCPSTAVSICHTVQLWESLLITGRWLTEFDLCLQLQNKCPEATLFISFSVSRRTDSQR